MSTDQNVEMEVADIGNVSSATQSPESMKGKKGRSRTYEDAVSDLSQLFEGSTHRYLIYFGHTKDLNGLIIAIGVVSLQWVLFGIMVREAVNLANGYDYVPLEVYWDQNCNDDGTLTFNTDFFLDVRCHFDKTAGYQMDNDGAFGTSMLGWCLLAFYLMGDVIQAIKAFFVIPGVWSKLGSLTVVLTGGYAAYTGSLYAFSGALTGSSFEALGNCIGVLFITDFDEKIYQALEHVQFGEKFKACCSCLCCKCCDQCFKVICVCICATIFIVIGFISALTVFIG